MTDLAEARAALARHDWQAAFDATDVVATDDATDAAARADMRADAAWWLGRLDDCIAARELAYRCYDDISSRQPRSHPTSSHSRAACARRTSKPRHCKPRAEY
jgi:hypothetical protein